MHSMSHADVIKFCHINTANADIKLHKCLKKFCSQKTACNFPAVSDQLIRIAKANKTMQAKWQDLLIKLNKTASL